MSIFDRFRKHSKKDVPAWATQEIWAPIVATLRNSASQGTVSTRAVGAVLSVGWAGQIPYDVDSAGKHTSQGRGTLEIKSIADVVQGGPLCCELDVTSHTATVHIVQQTSGLSLLPIGLPEIIRVEGTLPAPYRRPPAHYPVEVSPTANPQAVIDLVAELLPDAQPATDEEITQAETQWGVTLPEEIRALYRTASSGDIESHCPPQAWDETYMRITALDDQSRNYLRDYQYPWWSSATEVFYDPHGRVQDLGYSPGWFQIGDDGGGNLLLVDLTPGPNGNIGQILFSDHEQSGGASWVASSLAEFFALDDRYPVEQLSQDWHDKGERRNYRLQVGKDRTLDELSETTQVLIINSTALVDLKPISGHPVLRSVEINTKVTSLDVLATLPSLEWLSMSWDDWSALLDMDALPPTLMAAGFPDVEHLEPAMSVINRIRTAWGQDPCPVLTVNIPDSLVRQATT